MESHLKTVNLTEHISTSLILHWLSIYLQHLRKSFINNSPRYCLRPSILTIGIKAKFLKVTQVFDPKIFFMAEKLPFGEGTSINREPLFFGLNY